VGDAARARGGRSRALWCSGPSRPPSRERIGHQPVAEEARSSPGPSPPPSSVPLLSVPARGIPCAASARRRPRRTPHRAVPASKASASTLRPRPRPAAASNTSAAIFLRPRSPSTGSLKPPAVSSSTSSAGPGPMAPRTCSWNLWSCSTGLRRSSRPPARTFVTYHGVLALPLGARLSCPRRRAPTANRPPQASPLTPVRPRAG
jgi:hypothetical protein